MKKSLAYSLLGAAALVLLPTLGYSQVTGTTSATANIQPALSLSLVASPDWGKITRPPTGTARYTLDYSTGAVSLTSGDGYAFNDGAAGNFTLTGAPNAPVSFGVAIGAFDGTGITVVESHINGTTSSGTDTLDGTGNLTLKLGGVLDIDAAASLAVQTATVTVTVDYQ